MNPTPETEVSIFLSHTAVDKPFARQLAHDLRSAGAAVWIDEASLQLGDSLIQKIGDAISSVDYLAVVLSEESANSPWVQKEVQIATNDEICGKRVKVLPLLYKPCKIPSFLQDKLYADFSKPEGYGRALAMILGRLGLAEQHDAAERFVLLTTGGGTMDTAIIQLDEHYISDVDLDELKDDLKTVSRKHADRIKEARTSAAAEETAQDSIDEQIENAEASESIGDVWSAARIYESLRDLLEQKGETELAAEMQRRAKLNRRAAASTMRGDG